MQKRILIIDDEPHIRRMLRLTLEARGFQVGEASDGRHGLEEFGDGSGWDAVLLDQKMPGMDGLETLTHLKKRSPSARVIMITAFASIELAVDAMKLGATDFIRKPMTPQTVRNAVEAALSKPPTVPAPAVSQQADEESTAPYRPLIENVTMNGFSFVRASDVEGAQAQAQDERRFIVTSPGGWQREVVVEIDPEAVGYVERLTRRRLPPESSFWTAEAERLLGLYLWNEGKTPPAGRLVVTDVETDALPVAARWEENKQEG
jgi:FixJ family two-component response regulator